MRGRRVRSRLRSPSMTRPQPPSGLLQRLFEDVPTELPKGIEDGPASRRVDRRWVAVLAASGVGAAVLAAVLVRAGGEPSSATPASALAQAKGGPQEAGRDEPKGSGDLEVRREREQAGASEAAVTPSEATAEVSQGPARAAEEASPASPRLEAATEVVPPSPPHPEAVPEIVPSRGSGLDGVAPRRQVLAGAEAVGLVREEALQLVEAEEPLLLEPLEWSETGLQLRGRVRVAGRVEVLIARPGSRDPETFRSEHVSESVGRSFEAIETRSEAELEAWHARESLEVGLDGRFTTALSGLEPGRLLELRLTDEEGRVAVIRRRAPARD